MNYGMYVSTMGALVPTQRHATMSHNFAHSNTHGVNPDWCIFKEGTVENICHPGRLYQWDEFLINTGGGCVTQKTYSNRATRVT